MKAFYLATFIASVVCGWSLIRLETYEDDQRNLAKVFKKLELRDPAALQKSFAGFQHKSILKEINHRRFLSEMKLEKNKENFAVQLGHFSVGNQVAENEFICGYYDKVLLEFVGEGMAQSGESPILKVEAPCEVSKNVEKMRVIFIPFEKMEKIPVHQLSEFFFEKEGVFVTIENSLDILPKSWVFRSAKIFHTLKEERVFRIEPDLKERKKLSSALRMDW